MPMGETLEDAARMQAIKLGRKHNIADIERLTTIVKTIVVEGHKVISDAMRSKADPLQGTYGFIHSLDEALCFLSSSYAMNLFENTDPTMLDAFNRAVKNWFGGETPFYTLQELLDLITGLIKYLNDNKGPILLTGSPPNSFETSGWFDDKLVQLYPVKIPASAKNGRFLRRTLAERSTERRELVKKFIFMWLSLEEIKHPLPSLDLQGRIPSYEADPLMYSFTDREVERIEEKRVKLVNLKLAILETARRNITIKMTGTKDNSRFWNECVSIISNKLSHHDFQFLRAIERKYFNLRFLCLLSDELNIQLGEPTDEIRKRLRAGGICSLFDFILFVDRELRIGQMHTAKTQIIRLLGDERPQSYYQLVLSPNIDEINTIICQWWDHWVKNAEFREVFCRRLEKDIGKRLRVSVSTTLQRHEAIEAYAQFLEKHHNIGIHVTGRFAAPLANRREIYPPKLPPHTRWEGITIRFLDAHNVSIKAKDFHVDVDYKEMGFENKRSHLPNDQWEFLRLLASNHGELSWHHQKATTKGRKKKHLLAKALRTYFQIEDDPFFSYKQQKAYKIKVNLIPEDEPLREFTEPSNQNHQLIS